MADFKLTEVVTRAGLTVEEAKEKLKASGAEIKDTSDTISVEQMRILGVDPQLMIDRRKERLQQMIERRSRSTMGKEVVIGSHGKKEEIIPAPARRISREELLKRRTELDKELQKVDNDREQYLKDREDREDVEESEQVEVLTTTTDAAQEAVVETVVEVETTSKESVDKESVDKEPVDKEPVDKESLSKEPIKKDITKSTIKGTDRKDAPTRDSGTRSPTRTVSDRQGTGTRPQASRPTGPRADRDGSGARSERPTTSRPTTARSTTARPAGPRSDSTRAPASGRDAGRPFNKDSDEDMRGRGRPQTPKAPRQREESTSASLVEEQTRRRDKRPKEGENVAAQKEEARRIRARTEELSSRDWKETITEGFNELTMVQAIEEGVAAPVVEEKKAQEVRPQARRYDRRNRRRTRSRDLQAPPPRPTHINMGETITVAELAGVIGVKAVELVKKLFGSGIMVTVNQSIDVETATLLLIDYGVEVINKTVTVEDLIPIYEDDESDLVSRPPVVTVMGHVDHGKTSLLDAIRSATVAEREAGGITQHIGAYEVELNGRTLTFLDTPGHEAFTSLRARGAQVTDIVILVVAANDGVMPQTKEAIDHAKAAGVKVVVAINKIDRPDANSDRVRQQLAEYGIISEEWGGEHQFQEISAKKRTGIEDLLELVLLEAELLELKGNPKRPAEGIVIESQLDKQKGPVATVLVKNGILRRGDSFVVGSQVGKVRSMHNFRGEVVHEAGISIPVEVMGFDEVPESGDLFLVMKDDKVAKDIAELRARNAQESKHTSGAISLSDFFNKVKEGEVQELNIIIKTDVQGSLEALKSSLLKLSNVEVKVNVVHDATGGINESDVVLAMASRAIIIGFNVRPDNNARNLADKEGISLELYSVIYKAIEDVTLALEGMLTPDRHESIIGKVEVREVFSVPKIGKIAGGYVQEGKVKRSSQIRVIRDNVVIYDGKLGSLKRFTDDVREVTQGYELGLSVERYQDIKVGDILEAYEMVEEKRTLDDVKQDASRQENSNE